MDKGLEKEVNRYQTVLARTRAIRCEMIDTEMPVSQAKMILGIYDWGRFMRGEYGEEVENKLKEELKKFPGVIRERDRNYKEFRKALFLRGMKIAELEEVLGETRQKIYRVVRKITENQELKGKIEKELQIKIV
ncbi:hypothetical protein MVQ23_02585 [Fusobacterium necrophorum]|uniref:hypothetical protein n=1 Tax=Fusobacterium necrophorum TaxID=859 RepID=UPI002549EF4D|nr:hypothetical protein [Fusobacterium necrophorum]MDK4484749.1 hypothetical protein [Fusobacterium necrophorum]